jgi:hypothetical protein
VVQARQIADQHQLILDQVVATLDLQQQVVQVIVEVPIKMIVEFHSLMVLLSPLNNGLQNF